MNEDKHRESKNKKSRIMRNSRRHLKNFFLVSFTFCPYTMPLSSTENELTFPYAQTFDLTKGSAGSLGYRRQYIYGINHQTEIELSSHWVRNTGSHFAGEGGEVRRRLTSKFDCPLMELVDSSPTRRNLMFN